MNKMIPPLTCMILCILWSTTLQAQDRLNLRVGTHLSKIKDNNPEYNDAQSLLGLFHAGLSYQMPVDHIFSFQPELLYTQKGDRYYYYTGFNWERTRTRIILHYIQVPMMVKIGAQPTEEKPVRAFFTAGAGLGIALGKAAISTEKKLNNPEGFRRNIRKDVTNRLENTLQIGGGLQIKQDHSVELRYVIGLNDIYDYQSKGRQLELSLSFRFTDRNNN